MDYKLPQSEELDFIAAELIRHGVPFDEPIEKVARGFCGLCLIGETKVLKIFRNDEKPEDHGFLKRTYTNGLNILKDLAECAEEFARHNISVPRIIESGELAEPLSFDKATFGSWYIMTRLEGAPSHQSHTPWSVKKTKLFASMNIEPLIKIAARIQRPAAPDAQPEDPFDIWLWINKHRGIDKKILHLIKEVDRDTRDHFNGGKDVRIHSDLHPDNILWNRDGKAGVIDWDLRRNGKAESELRHVRYIPEEIKTICHRFNAIAPVPVSERVLVGLGFIDAITRYTFNYQSKPRSRNWPNKAHLMRDEKERLVAFATLMHRLTGKKIYAEAAKRFAKPERLSHPNRPVRVKVKDKKLER